MTAKKVIRRKRALQRFTILSPEDFVTRPGDTYAKYVARKEQELASLKQTA